MKINRHKHRQSRPLELFQGTKFICYFSLPISRDYCQHCAPNVCTKSRAYVSPSPNLEKKIYFFFLLIDMNGRNGPWHSPKYFEQTLNWFIYNCFCESTVCDLLFVTMYSPQSVNGVNSKHIRLYSYIACTIEYKQHI